MANNERWQREEAGLSEETVKELIGSNVNDDSGSNAVANNKEGSGDKFDIGSGKFNMETSNSGNCPEDNNEYIRDRSCSVTSQSMFVTQQELERRATNRSGYFLTFHSFCLNIK